jgi:hypothetical protein
LVLIIKFIILKRIKFIIRLKFYEKIDFLKKKKKEINIDDYKVVQKDKFEVFIWLKKINIYLYKLTKKFHLIFKKISFIII